MRCYLTWRVRWRLPALQGMWRWILSDTAGALTLTRPTGDVALDVSGTAGALTLTRPTGDVALDVSGTAGALALTRPTRTVAWGVTRPTQ